MRVVQIFEKVQITGHAKNEVHKKPYEFEDMQEMQKPGGKYKKDDFNSNYTHPLEKV